MTATRVGFGELAARGLNAVLGLDREARARLAPFVGKRLALVFEGGPQALLEAGPDGHWQVAAHEATADLTLTASRGFLVRALLSPARPDDPGGLRSLGISLNGDVELARDLRAVLGDFRPDWEEPLCRVLGDTAGHAIAQGLRALGAALEDLRVSATDNLTDWVANQPDWFPPKAEVGAFLSEVDHVRDDVERLAARVAHLTRGE